MPVSRKVAQFNKRFTNHIARHIAGWMPGFAIVIHTGRRSGRRYRTPVNAFRRSDRYVFALVYGSGSEWVRNVQAAGRCTIRTRRKDIGLVEPELFDDPRRRAVPAPPRWILGLVHVDEFLSLRVEGTSS
jgi:deazaflavin-dependent oxidoreductase (nitroreductase family)